MQRLRQRLGDLVRRAGHAAAGINRRLGGIPALLKDTFDSYNAHDGTLVSAAIAYYFFFTLFPLALALIAIGSLFLQAEQAKMQVTAVLVRVIPVAPEIIVGVIDQVVTQAGAIGILATLSFVYGASGLFGLLLTVINRIWACVGVRPSYVQRLLAIGLVFGFAVVVFLVSLATTAFEALSFTGLTGEAAAAVNRGVSVVGSVFIIGGLFLVLFWQLPATRVRFADAWPAAVATAVVWEAARELYGWYLSRFTRYTVVYGSLAAIIGLLAWFYLVGFMIQLGVELSAQVANRRGRGPAQCERPRPRG
ncbi:MAG TPA: YihY/virulence factor BrkB family protein [Anaerolineae bacterium]|nr:YihY/virulence factor BrkB family protein [Anaerolineae bacterium]HOQ97534.1 YihY/virulence factor BrkB family protein [Anaerolineae bacterium]HPL27519.1 YihY/virulence factor BrkB family protein [Anaerolineae bacterium]